MWWKLSVATPAKKMRDYSTENLPAKVDELLKTVQKAIFERALTMRTENTATVDSYDQFKKQLADKGGFVMAYWAGSSEDELKIKEETKATIRAIPFNQEAGTGKCFYTGQPATQKALFAVAY